MGVIFDVLIKILASIGVFTVGSWYVKKSTGSTSTTSSGSTGTNGSSLLGDIHWWGWVVIISGGFLLGRQFLKDKDDGVI